MLRILIGMAGAAGLLLMLLAHDWSTPAPWIQQAQASGFNSRRAQVVLFQHEIRDGRRSDRADPYLPVLGSEAEHARSENYDRCQVAVDQYQQTGQVRHVGFTDPRHLFTVSIDGERWREEHDAVVLEDVACFFAAGDVRRSLSFPVYDDQGKRLGQWRQGRMIEDPHS